MKLIVAIVQDYDCDRLLRAVCKAGYRATRIASTGGFLRTGNTTVLLGVPADQTAACIELLRQCCQGRAETLPREFVESLGLASPGAVSEVRIGGAVAFVVPVARFIRMARG